MQRGQLNQLGQSRSPLHRHLVVALDQVDDRIVVVVGLEEGPELVDERQMQRSGIEQMRRCRAVFLAFVVGAQIHHGADPERLHGLCIALAQPVEPVSPVEPTRHHPGATIGGIPTQIAQIEHVLQWHAGGLNGSGHRPKSTVGVVRALRVMLVLGVAFTGCGSNAPGVGRIPIRGTATVVAEHPHDPTAFTEGLVFGARNQLYESSGLYGSSEVREVDPTTGRVLRRTPLSPTMFGEGLGLIHGRVVQLTWREHVALIYDAATLARSATTYPVGNEGWGLSLDAAHHRWVQSDGTNVLTFRDESNFAVVGHRPVTLSGKPATRLN